MPLATVWFLWNTDTPVSALVYLLTEYVSGFSRHWGSGLSRYADQCVKDTSARRASP